MGVIEFAEKHYKECCDNEEYEDARYWAAYLDGARAQKKAYEDAEAEGRLVVLPCKVGDEIYRIVKPSGMCKKFVPMLPDKVAPFGIYYRNVMGGYSYIPLDDIGKTVFLTREEAEAALKGENTDA